MSKSPTIPADTPPQSRRKLTLRTPSRHGPEAGTTTAEYAIGTLAACGFAALLYKIVTSDSVASLLSGIVHKALGAVG
jgi:hypothetical protein